MLNQFQVVPILIGLVAISLIGLRVYISGAKCQIKKVLHGQVAVVTGGNTGIGYEVAKKLCALGCKVIIGARDQLKSKEAVQTIKRHTHGEISAFKLDLSEKQSIQKFASAVQSEIGDKSLNYLVNNAATIYISQRRITKQGIQMQLGVNHFGHFYLTYLLWPLIKICESVPRIINTSSCGCEVNKKESNLDLSDLSFEKREYKPEIAYQVSKKANILFTRQLQKRINKSPLNALTVSLHPGRVFTQCGRQIMKNPIKNILIKIFTPFLFLLLKTPRQGAQTTLFTILQSQNQLLKGEYYKQCKPFDLNHLEYVTTQNEEKLWEISEQIYGIKFHI